MLNNKERLVELGFKKIGHCFLNGNDSIDVEAHVENRNMIVLHLPSSPQS